jgi:hypothetical protein
MELHDLYDGTTDPPHEDGDTSSTIKIINERVMEVEELEVYI